MRLRWQFCYSADVILLMWFAFHCPSLMILVTGWTWNSHEQKPSSQNKAADSVKRRCTVSFYSKAFSTNFPLLNYIMLHDSYANGDLKCRKKLKKIANEDPVGIHLGSMVVGQTRKS